MPPPAALLGPAAIAALNLPLDSAAGTPRLAYTDPAFLALEREFVFDASWVFVEPPPASPIRAT